MTYDSCTCRPYFAQYYTISAVCWAVEFLNVTDAQTSVCQHNVFT